MCISYGTLQIFDVVVARRQFGRLFFIVKRRTWTLTTSLEDKDLPASLQN
jgi:hypothetical protein